MNSFTILGIEPTTDKRAIKRAYAKMLAKYHPEEYPEKFNKINQAYQNALLYATEVIDPSAEDYFTSSNYRLEDYDTIPADFLSDKNNINQHVEYSIFTTGDTFEILTSEEQQAQTTLDELTTILHDSGQRYFDFKAADKLINSKIFQQLCQNPYFINGLARRVPILRLTNRHIKLIRKLVGINKGRFGELAHALGVLDATLTSNTNNKVKDAFRYLINFLMRNKVRFSELIDAMDTLDAALINKARDNTRNIFRRLGNPYGSNFFEKNRLLILPAIVVFALLIHLAALYFLPEGDNRLLSPEPNNASQSTRLTSTITMPIQKSEFETYVVTCSNTNFEWRREVRYLIMDQVYEKTGRRPFTLDWHFDFFRGVYHFPEQVRFTLRDGPRNLSHHHLYLYVIFP